MPAPRCVSFARAPRMVSPRQGYSLQHGRRPRASTGAAHVERKQKVRRTTANIYHVGWDRTREHWPDRIALSDVMLRLAMSRGKVRRPVHNVEAPAKRRKTSPTIGIAIDTPKVMQGPVRRRRIKSQQQPRNSGAGLASETATEHRRRHRTTQPSCPRCMTFCDSTSYDAASGRVSCVLPDVDQVGEVDSNRD